MQSIVMSVHSMNPEYANQIDAAMYSGILAAEISRPGRSPPELSMDFASSPQKANIKADEQKNPTFDEGSNGSINSGRTFLLE